MADVASTYGIYKALNSWTEGTATGQAQTGSVSWNYRQYNTVPWNTPGGDYELAPEDARAPIYNWGYNYWKVTNMAQGWVSNPSSNYGGVLVNTGTGQAHVSAKEHDAIRRPTLTVTYSPSNIPKQSWSKNTNHTLDLSKYLMDPDGDILTFSASPTTNIKIGRAHV